GMENVTLLEEPQAAFYAWLQRMGDEWRTVLKKGDVVLVCDVGGGTTDFSLIAVGEENGQLILERIAVGEHLLLGGDNMDLALAHVLSWRLEGKLDAWQSRALWHACRAAKEELFTDPSKTDVTVAVGGRGTKLVGGLVKGSLTREDLDTIVVEGFFPQCAVTDRPAPKKRKAGFQELGLPFVSDPAISKHLASFLTRHARAEDAGFVRPRFVLFNGGVMKAPVLRERIRGLLEQWTGEPVRELAAADLDLAVAHGAADYGLVRKGRGIRIRGGAARSYYIGIESAMPAVPGMAAPLKALCVVPFGMEEGSEVSIPDREFGLVTGESVEFRFLGSTSRKEDKPGDLLESIPDDVEELAPIEAVLEAKDDRHEAVPVTLKARLTEVGTLDLFCVAKDRQRAWKLEYNVRTSPEEE
ncbi:MAG TPA: Hsp70 family protein, partial [Planctomycetota bacterium]|nr:Hsp70 family protein [Planctomycetota bacterium]